MDSRKQGRDKVKDWYVKELLRKQGAPITPKLIELKRQAIIIKRIERSMIDELTG